VCARRGISAAPNWIGFSPHCFLEILATVLPGDWILIVVPVMYYGMVKPLPIMSGKVPSEPVMAS